MMISVLPAFEPSPRIRVVYSDLDGTMLGAGAAFTLDPAGSPTIEPATALAAAHAAGIEVVPVSGRAMPGIARDARILGMPTAIGEMGAVLSYRHGREIVTALGDYPGGEAKPTDHMEETGAIALLLDRFPLEFHSPWAHDREYTALLRGLVDVEQANAALREAGMGWCALADNGMLHGAYLGLPAGASHVYHLMPKDVSKAAGVAFDRAKRGLAKGECAAIGDSVADLQMAGEVAVMVLTADAVEADAGLRAAATRWPNVAVTGRPGNLGWADMVGSLAKVARSGA